MLRFSTFCLGLFALGCAVTAKAPLPSDLDIDAALNGDLTAGSSALHEYVGGLRQTFETSTDVPVGAALAEFIDVVDLTTTTGATIAPGKKRKMITGISTFIATTTGKIVVQRRAKDHSVVETIFELVESILI